MDTVADRAHQHRIRSLGQSGVLPLRVALVTRVQLSGCVRRLGDARLTGSRGVVILAGVEWDPLWQSPQEIASRLAATGRPVLFVENSGVRAPRWRDAGRVVRRLRAALVGGGVADRRARPPGVDVLAPLVLPPFGGRVVRALNRLVFVPLLGRAARRRGFVDPDVWTWLPTDTALTAIERLRGPSTRVVYFCVSDFEELATQPGRLRSAERELVASSAVTVAHSAALEERLRGFGGDVRRLEPGVDLETFAAGAPRPSSPPAPVIGYVGSVHRFVNVELIAACARLRPEWRWVLVGPIARDCSAVEGLANVELMGPRPHAELGAIIAGFDVCVAPYTLEPGIQDVMPTKIVEYLAVGRPVVCSPLPAAVEFQRDHGVLEIAEATPEAFGAAVAEALAGLGDERAGVRRREVASRFSWADHFDRLSEWLDGPAPASRAGST